MIKKFVAISAALSICVAPVFAQQPVTWNYSFNPSGTAQANYPGNASSNNEINQGTTSGYGDSITYGNQDGTGVNWPTTLTNSTGQYTINHGVGGQTSSQIAVRMNAYANSANQTFASGFTIPTSGSVAVTFPSGFEPAYGATFAALYPTISFVLNGVTYSGTVSDNGSHVYSFTPSNYPTSPVTVANGINYQSVYGNDQNGCVVIEEGRNNYSSFNQVLADVAASVKVASTNSSCYVVLSILNSENEPSGSSGYNQIIALNNALASQYPNNYVDIRTALVNAASSYAADVIDKTNDVPPYTLRAQDLSGTLTAAVTTTGQTTFAVSATVGTGSILTFGSELVYVTAGTVGAGNITVTRGYASTTASTYTNGTAYTGVDSLHPGRNSMTQANNNTNYNGYVVIANAIKTWESAYSGSSINQNSFLINAANLNNIRYNAGQSYNVTSASGIPSYSLSASGYCGYGTGLASATCITVAPTGQLYMGNSLLPKVTGYFLGTASLPWFNINLGQGASSGVKFWNGPGSAATSLVGSTNVTNNVVTLPSYTGNVAVTATAASSGSTTATLGTTGPMSTAAPYGWFAMPCPDVQTNNCYLPVWK